MIILAFMVKNLVILLLILSACSPKIISYINERSDFSSYESFYVINLKKGKLGPEDVTPRLEDAIRSNMLLRNYTIDKENPDLILRYEVVSSTKSNVSVSGSPFMFGSITRNVFNESIILFEMKDGKTNKLVWQASIDMNDHAELLKRKDPLKAAVNELFSSYLYKAGEGQPDPTLIQK